MKLSTRTRYGVRAVFELAKAHGEGLLQISAIAQRQGISPKYLEQLMAMLKSGGFVESIRGSKGGYRLARPPNQIHLAEVFDTLEGSTITVQCLTDEKYCTRTANCVIRQVWGQVEKAIDNVLKAVTLQDLVDKLDKENSLHYQT